MSGMHGEHPDGEPAASEAAGVRRAALVSGATGVALLATALVVYLAGGAPYGQNVAGAVLYLAGLLVALVAGVLLWMAWSTPEARRSPRRPGGVATAAGTLLVTGASVVLSLGRVGSPGLRLGFIGAAAVVLAAAVAALAPEARRPR